MNGLRINGDLAKYNDDISGNFTLNLKETSAAAGTMNADLDNMKFILNHLTCSLGKDGLKSLESGLKMEASDLHFSNDGMSTSTESVSMKADKAKYLGDSINVKGFTFNSNTITLNLSDSTGSVTEAGIDKRIVPAIPGLRHQTPKKHILVLCRTAADQYRNLLFLPQIHTLSSQESPTSTASAQNTTRHRRIRVLYYNGNTDNSTENSNFLGFFAIKVYISVFRCYNFAK